MTFSGCLYVEAFADETVQSWIQGIAHSLPSLILRPDNTRTATIKADKYEPKLHAAMVELSEHYHTICLPARVRKPRDKHVVEASVGLAERHILAVLRDQRFSSLEDMNTCIRERMDCLNKAGFKKKQGSHLQLPALPPLPDSGFELLERAAATVSPDYHIQFGHCFYSVPSGLIGDKVGTARAYPSNPPGLPPVDRNLFPYQDKEYRAIYRDPHGQDPRQQAVRGAELQDLPGCAHGWQAVGHIHPSEL